VTSISAASFSDFVRNFPPYDLTRLEITDNILQAALHKQQGLEAQEKLRKKQAAGYWAERWRQITEGFRR
jgi:hypothetical protein